MDGLKPSTNGRRASVFFVPAACMILAGPTAAAATDCFDVMGSSIKRDHIFDLCEAAEKGDPGAMYWLGVAFIEGVVVADYDRGVFWLRKATRAGNKEAERLYNFIDSAQIGPGC